MVHWPTRFILPLVDHLVEEGLYCLVEAVSADVPAADCYLRTMLCLTPQSVVTKPRLHPAGNANWNGAELAAELRRIESPMCSRKLTNHMLIA
jgi:hypothetical protein